MTVSLALATLPPPLPACGRAPSQQLVVLSRVNGLVFDVNGDLWVADAGSLTRRSDDLDVIEAYEPGAHGWDGVFAHPDAVVATNTLGSAWGSDGDGRGAGSWVGVICERPYRPRIPGATLDQGGVYTPEGELRFRLPEPGEITATALRHSDGVLAIATVSRLWVFDAGGELLGEREVLPTTEASGLHADRLFTVDRGELRLWGADGRSIAVPGTWSSAVSTGRELVATEAGGDRWSVQLGGPEPFVTPWPEGRPEPAASPRGHSGIELRWMGDELVVGRVHRRHFRVLEDLPPRWTLQARSEPRVAIDGDRFVIAGDGPTEVWCAPDGRGRLATNRPGVLARRVPSSQGSSSPFSWSTSSFSVPTSGKMYSQ
ncbi:MAG: hypothetical protein H6734_10120 [Alphaproteobacteria bacterium]|nr:hypothetical protein [Alphaproteobacteria bacterium]